MDLRRVRPTSIALIVAGLVVLSVGDYTHNGGFRLAGGILALVGLLQAVLQVRT